MKITFVTAVWKRPHLTKIVLEYYAGLCERYDASLVVAMSPEDIPQTLPKCAYGVLAPNEPVAQKFNFAFNKAKDTKPDVVILTGSDDLVSTDLIDHYLRVYSPEKKYVYGLKDFYFYSLQDQKAYHWKGFVGDESKVITTIGAGRIFSKKILQKLDWLPYGKLTVNRGLDNNSIRYMRSMNVGEEGVLMKDSGIAIDIKHEANINTFKDMRWNCEDVDYKQIFSTFEKEYAELDRLRIDMTRFPKGKTIVVTLKKSHVGDIKLGMIGSQVKVEGSTAYGLYKNGIIELP